MVFNLKIINIPFFHIESLLFLRNLWDFCFQGALEFACQTVECIVLVSENLSKYTEIKGTLLFCYDHRENRSPVIYI